VGDLVSEVLLKESLTTVFLPFILFLFFLFHYIHFAFEFLKHVLNLIILYISIIVSMIHESKKVRFVMRLKRRRVLFMELLVG
jgi:hypothetical protein